MAALDDQVQVNLQTPPHKASSRGIHPHKSSFRVELRPFPWPRARRQGNGKTGFGVGVNYRLIFVLVLLHKLVPFQGPCQWDTLPLLSCNLIHRWTVIRPLYYSLWTSFKMTRLLCVGKTFLVSANSGFTVWVYVEVLSDLTSDVFFNVENFVIVWIYLWTAYGSVQIFTFEMKSNNSEED